MAPADKATEVFKLGQQADLDPMLAFQIAQNIARVSSVPWLNPATRTDHFHLTYNTERALSAGFKANVPAGVVLSLTPLNETPENQFREMFEADFSYYADKKILLESTSKKGPNVFPEDDVTNVERLSEFQQQAWRFLELDDPMAGRNDRMEQRLKKPELTSAIDILNQSVYPLLFSIDTRSLLQGARQVLRMRNINRGLNQADRKVNGVLTDVERVFLDFVVNQGKELILNQTGHLGEPPVYEPLLRIFEHGLMPYGLEIPEDPTQKGKLKVLVPPRTRLVS
jgi:hypothetical protein